MKDSTQGEKTLSLVIAEIENFLNKEEKYDIIYIEKIEKNTYTKKKHEKFMNKFGVLIKGLKLNKLKKPLTFIIGFYSLFR